MRARVEKPEDVGRLIHRIRSEAHLTQNDFAAALGTSQRYVSELEAGKPKRIDANYFHLLEKLGIVMYLETENPRDD